MHISSSSKSIETLFRRYISVGVVNTLIHWLVFYIALSIGFDQGISNLTAFAVAVTFSFVVNAKYTFSRDPSFVKYLIYTSFMGLMALTIGYVGERVQLPAIVTLITFSAISLVMGFIFSKFVVFKES
ncbi:hypothetical protein ABT56_09780 [Photobacterium aquae]|uniref:Bactoprenol-linked glucose translocase n=1 Tax=Photobacterium aquae TaxID=1195763 RepID=A0A0J1H210_9GAMM|nr:GtrA family protein [Photobacterium aquae]KLV05823.1 hypothetical protein ABT56_09780 [Photobacterium aquae]